MTGGAIVTAAATVLFGFARPVAGMFSEEGSRLVRSSAAGVVVGGALITHQYRALAICLAILAIYIMDFSINAGMHRTVSQCVSLAEFPS